MAEKRLTDLLFGNLLDEFGDAAAPVIRKVLSALGADASEKVARDAVRREVRTAPSQNKTTRASSAAATPPKKKAPAAAPKPKATTPPAQGSSLAAKPEKPLAARPPVVLTDVRPSPDDVYEVMDANTTAGRVTGDITLPIDQLTGGVVGGADDARRVDQLVEEMSSPSGYISRLIVDDAGNVIEGQHRLEALRRLGVSEVPVTQYMDLERAIPFSAVRDAAEAQGIHPDNANQIAKQLAEIYADEGGDMAEVMQYAAPKGFEDAWEAATSVLAGNTSRGAPSLAARPAAAPITNVGFLDEGKWELPADFGADVPIVTIGPAIIPSRRPTTAWHGTPHVFAAERKVLTPTGEEIFIAGAPDVLPDVPADFSVLKDFPLGRFRSDRLGTGEGAQQYGIGTYVAENPEVARMYRNELTQDEGEPSIAGVPLEVFYNQLQRRADKADPDRAEALYNRLSSLEDLGLYGDVRGVLDLAETGAYSPETMDWFKREIVPKYSAPGALYEVEIGVDPREFLDYDRPLASQTETVRRAVANMDLSGLKEGNRSRVMLERFLQNKEQPEYQATGQTLLTALPHSPELEHTLEGSLYLLGQGIPGIRYQDFNSRGTPRGTSNFVVFDPERDLAVKNRFSRGGMAALTDNYGC